MRRQRRPHQSPTAGRRTAPAPGLESLVGPGAPGSRSVIWPATMAKPQLVPRSLRIPLVVRILGRKTDRLGRPPRRHRHLGLGQDGHRAGPRSIRSWPNTRVPFKDGYPIDDTRYNTATEFQILATFADGTEIEIRSDGDNGILFEGSEGHMFVNRGRLTGKPVDDLRVESLPAGALEEVYKNRPLTITFAILRGGGRPPGAGLGRVQPPSC